MLDSKRGCLCLAGESEETDESKKNAENSGEFRGDWRVCEICQDVSVCGTRGLQYRGLLY